MKTLRGNPELNADLKQTRGVSCKDIVLAIDGGGLLDVVEHPHREWYPNQAILVGVVAGSVHLMPCGEESTHFFPKTIIPSRKSTRDTSAGGER